MKTLKKSYLNSIEKIKKLGFKEPAAAATRTNPFTGRSLTLQPLEVMLYDFITTRTFVCGQDYTRQMWDHARYAVLELNPQAYYDLID